MKKVMVVDDASTVRMYHKALLEEIGIFILEASNAKLHHREPRFN